MEAKSDTSLFVFRRGDDMIYLLLYVDDIVLTASSTGLLQCTITSLQSEFAMKDLGELHRFLGMHVQRRGTGLFLSQHQYMVELLERAGALQWLTFTRPDISYAVQQVCLFMHDPREPHLTALKHILRYVRGMLHMGLLLQPSRSSDLTVYSDVDWASCPDTRRSTSGYAAFLGDNLVSWPSKRQNTVSRSSAEAEYRAMANGMAEATWFAPTPARASCAFTPSLAGIL